MCVSVCVCVCVCVYVVHVYIYDRSTHNCMQILLILGDHGHYTIIVNIIS